VERDKLVQEREELKGQVQKVLNKETQFKHELRNKELMIQKLQDQLNKKLLEKQGKPVMSGQLESVGPAVASQDIKFSKVSGGGDGDFHLMIAKSQEDIYKKLCVENMELKECLKQLQKEIFDIVDFKTEIFVKR